MQFMAFVIVKISYLLLGLIQSVSSTNPKAQLCNLDPQTPFLHCSRRALSSPLLAFASCAPPRFDEFSEKIVGTWSSSRPPPITAEEEVLRSCGEVEEVMRACGGAVQGIREMPLFHHQAEGTKEEERLYHNRADDGFIFMDNGSYTSGPVQCSFQEGGESSKSEELILPDFVTSLSFSTLPRIRSIVTSIPLTCQTFLRNLGSRTLSSSSEGIVTKEGEDPVVIVKCSDTSPSNIQWETETCCRMPSSSQPWMIQRVKWETFVSKMKQEENSTNGLVTPIDVGSITISGWVCSQKLEEGHDRQSLWCNPDIGRLLNEQGSHYVIQMGCVLQETMDTRSFLRCYDEEGKLNVIVYQEGQLIQTPEE